MILERNRLAIETDMLDHHPRGRDTTRGKTASHPRRLHREHNVHTPRVVLEVQSRPEADLEHAAFESASDSGAPAAHSRAAASAIHKARKDLLTVDAHLQTVLAG